MMWIILDREEYLDDVLSALLELEITGATVLDGVGMERVLAIDVPIFAGLIESLSGSRPYNKNIIAVVRNQDIIFDLLDLLREIGIDFQASGTGRLFALPIGLSVHAAGIWPENNQEGTHAQ